MTPWFPIALGVIVLGMFGLCRWLTVTGDRRAAEERAERDLAARPESDVEWLHGLNPEKAADLGGEG